MPRNTVLCRVCLVTDLPMLTIADTPLQDVYEKITNTPLNTLDLRPVLVCNMCCALLKKCHKLMLTSAKADNMLARILERHPNASKSSKKLLTLVKRKTKGLCDLLSITPIDYVDTSSYNTPIMVKTEFDNLENMVKCEPEELEDIVKQEIEFEKFDDITSEPENKPDECKLDLQNDEVMRSIQIEHECLSYKVNMKTVDDHNWHENLPDNETEELLLIDRKLGQKTRKLSVQEHSDTVDSISFPSTKEVKKIDINKRYFECNECQRRFSRKCHLETHMFVHYGGREKLATECYICHKRLCSKASFGRHMRTHTGEKPYACTFCSSRFKDSGVLKNHLRTHTGEKPYKCDVCERAFKQLNDLRRHARIHTGEKPYKCDICQRRFNEKSKVTRHAKRHYGEKLTKRDWLKLHKH
ncbi:zinc finger protein 892 isoform X2 [Amyelois transitella]|uniref:zinc finger protein 892 isoform X2 n=1 Tax=Amyelois transitella TaxID=680683 RepID=UPI00067D468A|nr:zinc finger protein 892 isoform X2 [Amyelois transitella]